MRDECKANNNIKLKYRNSARGEEVSGRDQRKVPSEAA
jgi:hypothetical protein